MDNEVKITVVEFYAFNMKSQRAYINQSEEQILADMEQICKTNRLLSLSNYKAVHLETKSFTVDEAVMEDYLLNHPEIVKSKSEEHNNTPKTESNEKNQP